MGATTIARLDADYFGTTMTQNLTQEPGSVR
jgi:hypothetical protein